MSTGRSKESNAATGASAAGMRALTAQFAAFYFRIPVKAFLRSRLDYMVRFAPSVFFLLRRTI